MSVRHTVVTIVALAIPSSVLAGNVGIARSFLLAFLLAACVSEGGPLSASVRSDTGADVAPTTPSPPPPTPSKEADMKIRLVVGETVLTVTLVDNAAARDFVKLLPLELTLRDYAKTEKVSDLPRRLDTSGTPAGMDPNVGDLTYYAPWGNLAIFYRDFGYAEGLVELGRLDAAGIETLARKSGEFVVRFELEKAP